MSVIRLLVNATSGTQVAITEKKKRGRFRAALSKRSMQADVIVILISVSVLIGGLYFWQVYGTYAFPSTLCGVNASCRSSFNTMSDCKYYASENGFPPSECVRVLQDNQGFDAMVVGIALLAVSAASGLFIVFTTKMPAEATVKVPLS